MVREEPSPDWMTCPRCRLVDLRRGAGDLTGARLAGAVRKIIHGDNLVALAIAARRVRLGHLRRPAVQHRQGPEARSHQGDRHDRGGDAGDRGGFGGRRYTVERVASSTYDDSFDDFEAFLMPRIEAALRCLTKNGSLFVHLDYREVHYVKVALDRLLGRDRFVNEIIWAYDYGGAAEEPLARQARHDPLVRARPGRLRLRLRRHRSHPVHGAGPGRQGEGRDRQDADRRVVAHGGADERQARRRATRRRSRSACSRAS